jgi:Acyl-CoA thioesterase C-terminal domain
VPLLPDEEPTGLQRVLAVADSGNGVSAGLPLGKWLFINPELTVHFRRARGEWICLDAETAITEGGAGLATLTLSDDDDGVVAHGAQCLLVAPRSA